MIKTNSSKLIILFCVLTGTLSTQAREWKQDEGIQQSPLREWKQDEGIQADPAWDPFEEF